MKTRGTDVQVKRDGEAGLFELAYNSCLDVNQIARSQTAQCNEKLAVEGCRSNGQVNTERASKTSGKFLNKP